MRNVSRQWYDGVSYEVAFWNNVYRWKHTFNGMIKWSNFGKCINLECFDANKFLLGKSDPKVLDVGCGLSFAPGDNLLENGKLRPLNISYVDPLAPFFNDISKRFHRNVPKITYGRMEYLSAFFGKTNNILLVIIQNALDHSSDPLKGILEALDILETGGILYLNHHNNEAVTEHYKGFHKFNVCEENGHLMIWNKESKTDVNGLLKGFAEISMFTGSQGHVVAIIKKTAEIPDSMIDRRNDIKNLNDDIAGLIKLRGSFWNSLSYQFNFLKYNTIQFFAQSLTWKMKMGLKRIIGQGG